ncbi:hypothetical protein LshimejAT787_0500770 [Lyophyllum shimeji]|uniref:Uncharacterized protein n=1 Tax=Lyophyllum shimeji TaxID=47721 RepID=A0A9P3PKY4_LYOSH|nr:hypothetical protein LshimejAT787_0500770 [Lyophyllum shimeji]
MLCVQRQVRVVRRMVAGSPNAERQQRQVARGITIACHGPEASHKGQAAGSYGVCKSETLKNLGKNSEEAKYRKTMQAAGTRTSKEGGDAASESISSEYKILPFIAAVKE